METKINIKFNWPFFGNKHIIDYLQNSIANKNLAHFYIFAGVRDLGKSTVAKYFAHSLLCESFSKGNMELPCLSCSSCRQAKKGIHSDILQIDKQEDKKNISIEQIRGFIKMMNMGTFMGTYKIGIIKSAENLSTEAANALLKTLEEPKKNTVIILMTDFVETLPSTIISRAQVLKFLPTSASEIHDYLIQEYKAGRNEAKTLSHLCLGRPALAAKLLEDKDFLQKTYGIINALLDIMDAPSYKQFLLIDDILKMADKNFNSRDYTEDVLHLWQSLVRDIMLKNVNAQSLMTVDDFFDKNKNFNISLNKLVNINKQIEKGKKYLAANVQPRLILENISLQF